MVKWFAFGIGATLGFWALCETISYGAAKMDEMTRDIEDDGWVTVTGLNEPHG